MWCRIVVNILSGNKFLIFIYYPVSKAVDYHAFKTSYIMYMEVIGTTNAQP